MAVKAKTEIVLLVWYVKISMVPCIQQHGVVRSVREMTIETAGFSQWGVKGFCVFDNVADRFVAISAQGFRVIS